MKQLAILGGKPAFSSQLKFIKKLAICKWTLIQAKKLLFKYISQNFL